MNKKTFIALMIVFTAACAFVFNIFYREAKNTAVTKLNEEQTIHAKQAARGIEEFFATWTRDLNSLSKMDEIVDTDAVGKRYMKLFYEANQEQIGSITRLDERGVILHNFPQSGSVGTDISDQKHVRELLRDHEPVISDVFRAVEGFDAVALHVPVFRGSEFKGSIGILINFEGLAKRYLDVIKIGETGYAWVVSRDGTQLYSPISGFTGKSVFETGRDSPSLIVMADDMLKGHEGAATYTFDGTGGRNAGQIREYAVYMPVPIGSTFWSIAVASGEQDVLSGLISFRNKLAFVIGALFICGMVFSTLAAKAWFIVKEEEKRKQAEKKLQESEQIAEKFSTLFHAAPFAMALTATLDGMLYDVNQAWLDLAGFTRREGVIGKSSIELELIREAEQRDRILDRFRQHGAVRNAEIATFTRAGAPLALLVNLDWVDIGGRKFILSSMQDITERKHTEEELRESEAKYRTLFENMTEEVHFWRVVRDEAGRIETWRLVDANPPTLITWGRSSLDEIRGKTTDEIFGPGAVDHYMPVVQKIMTEGVSYSFEDFFPNLDRYFRFTSVPLGDYFITTGADITGIKKIEQALRKAHDELEERVRERTAELVRAGEDLQEQAALLNLAHDAIFVRSSDHFVKFWNKGAEELYGFTKEEALGKVTQDLLHTGFPEPIDQIVDQVLKSGRWEGELRQTTSTGKEILVESRWVLQSDMDGKPLGFLELNRDITPRKMAEEKFRKADRAFMTLSECNQAIVRQTDEMELLRQTCRIVVEVGGYRMVWVGFAEHDEKKTVRPVAHAGYDGGYLDGACITWADEERGRGPTGTAIRTGEIGISKDALSNPAFTAWRSEAAKRGYASSIAFPLIVDGQAAGALTIYVPEPDAFDEREVTFLSDLAENLAYGITSIRSAIQRRRSEEALKVYTARLELTNQELQEFAFVASHDLQEPLRKIQTFCDMAMKRCAPVLDSTSQDYLDR